MFAHCDVNAFYASCQTAFRPDLKGRPVVVLSNNDGCVIARSAEAKPFVKMGEPYFKQKAAFLRHGVVAFSSNYELYADMSSRVMATLEELTPRCEIYSIDEAFCDVSGVRHCRDLTDFGREIRATVLQRTHLTLGVGIAQLNLFDELAPRHNSARLMQVLDQLNAKNGRGALYFAAQGIQQQWQMKREMLSPRYTTRYGDLLRVR